MIDWHELAVLALTNEPQRRGSAIDDCSLTLILTYTAEAHKTNPDAEISGAELQHELGLDATAVRECVAELAKQGLVECDLMLSNLWLRITDRGLMVVARGLSRRPAPGRAGPADDPAGETRSCHAQGTGRFRAGRVT
jgi:hypothetical protein